MAGRWVGIARRECPDHLPILSVRHLRRVLTGFVAHYNERRPHQGLEQQCGVPLAPDGGGGRIARRDVLALVTHDHYPKAA